MARPFSGRALVNVNASPCLLLVPLTARADKPPQFADTFLIRAALGVRDAPVNEAAAIPSRLVTCHARAQEVPVRVHTLRMGGAKVFLLGTLIDIGALCSIGLKALVTGTLIEADGVKTAGMGAADCRAVSTFIHILAASVSAVEALLTKTEERSRSVDASAISA